MEIRKFKKEDAVEASLIIKECFEKLDIGKHTDRGIQLQIEGNSPENLIKRSENIKYFVAIENDKVIGICGYDEEKVHTLFVEIKYHKFGIGRKLLNKVLHEAKNEGLKSITTWSTIYAENFYESFGFKKINDINITESTKDIVLIEMEKEL